MPAGDALDGRPTAAAYVLRNAVSSDDGHLHQLVQSLFAPAYVAPCTKRRKPMNVHRRLLALERKTKRGDGVLILPDGGTLVIQVSDWLGLTLAAMNRQHARISGRETPVSKFGRTLDLLQRAVDVGPGSPPLLGVAWSVLQGSQGYVPDEDDLDFNSTTIN